MYNQLMTELLYEEMNATRIVKIASDKLPGENISIKS